MGYVVACLTTLTGVLSHRRPCDTPRYNDAHTHVLHFLMSDTIVSESVGVEVRPSRIPGAGLGVFATRSYARGEEVCFYQGREVRPGDDIPITETKYLKKLSDGTYLLGDSSVRSGRGVAQLINAPCMMGPLDLKHPPSDTAVRAESFKCWRAELEGSNVACKGTTYVAHRAIAAGEELLSSYGPSYWIGEQRIGAEDELATCCKTREAATKTSRICMSALRASQDQKFKDNARKLLDLIGDLNTKIASLEASIAYLKHAYDVALQAEKDMCLDLLKYSSAVMRYYADK